MRRLGHWHKQPLVVLAVLGALVMLAGCGGSGGTSTNPGLAGRAADDTADDTASDTGNDTASGGAGTDSSDTDSSDTDSSGDGERGSGDLGSVCRPGAFTPPARAQLAFYAQCVDNNDMALFPVMRTEPDDQASVSSRLQQRLNALVLGLSPQERSLGLGVGFDDAPDADLIEVTARVADGIASVDFTLDSERWNPGGLASSSAQLSSFLDPLLATTMADPEIAGLDLDGLCWGDLGCEAGVVDRAAWESQLFTNQGVLSYETCDLTEAWLRPGECTVEGQLAGELTEGRVVNVADDDTLNLRAGPGIDYAVVAELAPRSAIEATSAVALANDGGRWVLIDAAAGTGWANSSFVSLGGTDDTPEGTDDTPGGTDDTSEGIDDTSLVEAFMAFARDQRRGSFDALPLAAEVRLGLGPDLKATVAADALADPDRWVLDADSFRGYDGPLSALEVMARMNRYEVTRGPHDHCAAGPMPPPASFNDSDRVSVQPDDESITSCLEWGTVDFFLNDVGLVEAVTLDLWAP